MSGSSIDSGGPAATAPSPSPWEAKRGAAKVAAAEAGGYAGTQTAIFRLALGGILLTVLTVGVYRFWMKTHLRRYYWAHTTIGGAPLEYTGRGVELFLGFLVAVAFLAVYLLIASLAIGYLSVAEPDLLGVLVAAGPILAAPFIPYAKYRSERYLLARTRWSGIRFSLERNAWGYVGLFFAWVPVVILSLGLAYPFMDYSLRRYITGRTAFGDQPLTLEGSVKPLFQAFLGVWLFVLLGLLVLVASEITLQAQPDLSIMLAILLLPLLLIILVLWFRYSALRFRIIVSATRLRDGDVRLRSDLDPLRYAMMVAGGGAATLFFVAAAVVGGLVLALPLMSGGPMPFETGPTDDWAAQARVIGPLVLIYLVVIIVAVVSTEVLVTSRAHRLLARSVSVEGVQRLRGVRQGAHADEKGGEGFADALDVGAF